MAVSLEVCMFTVLTVLSLCNGVSFAWDRTINVSLNSGQDNCDRLVGTCRTLDRALDLAFQNGPNSTLVSLQAGSYTLGKKRNFTNVHDFAIVGHNGSVEIRCSVNVSFHFVLSDTILLEGFHLHKCGEWHASSVGYEKPFKPMKNAKFLTAMNFVYCRNIRLSDVRISETAGLAVNLYDVAGEVSFTNCFFSENIARPSNNSSPSMSEGYANAGGGIFLFHNMFGFSPVEVKRSEHESYSHNNTYSFMNCTFLRNEAPKPGLKDHLNSPQVPFSRGGGLGIYFRGDVSGCRILIRDCSFLNNKAQWGGGLEVEFRDRSVNNALVVENTVFEGNIAQFAGGGVRAGNIRKRNAGFLAPNLFTFRKCLFRNNSAVWGGAVALYGTSSLLGASSNASLCNKLFLFSQTRFLDNTATVASALGIYMLNRNEAHIGPEVPFHVELRSCDVINNDVINKGNTIITGKGAIYSLEAQITLSGQVTIANNTNTALCVDGTTVIIDGRVMFVNNSGFRGGALSMYGRSKVRLSKKSSLVFRENSCQEKGGALYVATPGAQGVNFNETGLKHHLCFIAYEDPIDFDDWDATLEFQGNRGPNEASGRAVYATTLKTCRRIGESRFNNTVLEWKFVKYLNSTGVETNAREEISTDPIDMVFNRNDWMVAPNELFNATLELRDEKGQHVQGIVHVEIESTDSPAAAVKLNSPSSLFLVVHGKMSFVRLSGKIGGKFKVNLRSIGQQVLFKQISNLFLRPCYPGFRLEKTKCVCADTTVEGIARCSKDAKTMYLRRNFWGGKVDGKFATYRCPDNYCNCSETPRNDCKYVQGQMCKLYRNQSSILCGACKRDYGVRVGSEVCSNDCSDLYLLLLPVYGLAIVLVVMAIMVINLDVFTGYLNAWLYSYQVVSFLVREDFAFDPFMTFIIGLVNFQFRFGGSGMCLAAGLDEADKLALSYVMPVFLLVVICVLIKIVGAFPNWWFSRKVRAPFRAYCTVAVFSYTVITGISLKILHPAIIHNRAVLFQNGELDFFAGKHIAYGTLAIFFVLTFVLPFPVLLMFRPSCTKCLRPVFNMNRLKPIFDALQSCFEDDKRWCAAFYFVCRLAILVVATYVPLGPVRRTLLQTICIVTLAIFAYLKPYKQENCNWINKSDVVLLTNLALIAMFSGAIGQTHYIDSVFEIFIDLFAYVPLIVLAIVVYRLVKKRMTAENQDQILSMTLTAFNIQE